MTHEYQIEGMTCQACAATVENALANVTGVNNVHVDLASQKAVVDMDHHIDTKTLKEALKSHPKYQISDISNNRNHFADEEEEKRSFWETYKPILLVFIFLFGFTTLNEIVHSDGSLMRWMQNFMAGFFIVFSFFKLLDLKSFAYSYATYDVIAKRWMGWGFIYPFVELALGIAFFTGFNMLWTNMTTIVVMGLSSVGVIQSLLQKRKIKCACLGAVFNLPMSTITLFEDLLMVIMSVVMIVYYV